MVTKLQISAVVSYKVLNEPINMSQHDTDMLKITATKTSWKLRNQDWVSSLGNLRFGSAHCGPGPVTAEALLI